jgi:hypothetical protein
MFREGINVFSFGGDGKGASAKNINWMEAPSSRNK